MKIIDCFIYSDEDMLLDIRLNVLKDVVDKFVVVEASYKHNGDKKNKNFNINKFSNFANKIDYFFVEQTPDNLYKISKNDSKDQAGAKHIKNSIIFEHYQRNKISVCLKKYDDDDIILISDLDEIPNLKNFNPDNFRNKLTFFNHRMFYYKFNLEYKKLNWIGTKACRKKDLISPQWLRDTKNRKYPFFRLDTLFSKKKYIDVNIIEDGGWHFTQLKNSADLFDKLNTFAHHIDFKESGLNKKDIDLAIKEKRVLYDHFSDQKSSNKWQNKQFLEKIDINILPNYIKINKDKYDEWFD